VDRVGWLHTGASVRTGAIACGVVEACHGPRLRTGAGFPAELVEVEVAVVEGSPIGEGWSSRALVEAEKGGSIRVYPQETIE